MNAVERFVAAIETISDGFALLDENHRFLLINAKFRQFYTLADSALRIGAPFANFVRTMATAEGLPDPEAVVAERMARFATPGEPYEQQLADGRWIRVADYHTDNGGVICLRTDITERVRRDRALAESEARTRAIVETALDAIVTIDESGAIVEFNPAAERVFGYARGDALGRQVAETIVAPRHRDAHLAGFTRYLDTGERVLLGRRIEIEAMRADGEVFPVELTMTELGLGERRLFTAFIRDLTEAKRLEREMELQRERLHQSEKLGALGSLLAGVAHELNNPLSVVVAQASMLEEFTTDERDKSRAQRIHAAAERCARIIRSFLAMARQRPPHRGAVEIGRLIDDALELVTYGLTSAGIAIERDVAPDLPTIWGDGDQLNQVLTNLLINAQQAMQETPPPRRLGIEARADPDGNGILVTVIDSGPGVPPEIRGRVFEPFFTTKPVGLGTGVGLSVGHGVVQAHGGSITVDDAPGGGAKFTVHLPIGTPVAAAAPAKPAPDAVRPSRLLVVDDEPEIVDTIAEVLTAVGHQVDTAMSGAAALERIAETDYDMIFSDLRMPDLDGAALFEHLSRERPALARRMVIVTGDMLSADARAFVESSGLVCLEKPFTIEEVRRIAAQTLADG